MDGQRLLIAALGLVGGVTGIPVGLAQLDFGGVLNFANIENGDAPAGLVALAAVSGIFTLAFAALGIIGATIVAWKTAWGSRMLAAAALGGAASATIFWVLQGLALGTAAVLAHRLERARPAAPAVQ